VKALQVFAGPRALARLRERGLQASDVRVIPAAAGGPKGLALLPLDRFIFGQWLSGSTQTVHLMGASIGSWRMAAACVPDADAALAELAEDYITQTYPHKPGKMPTARSISEAFAVTLDRRVGAQAATMLQHPRYRLHVITSRGRRWLHRPGSLAMPAGWMAAFAANAVSRHALGGWMERVVFSDPREPLPFDLTDYPTQSVPLTAANMAQAVLASCSIPFALLPVQDVLGGPSGTYWDGGITDYHLHFNYATMQDGLVLYPHFISQVVPGWLDKAWKQRHKATAWLDNLVLLAPQPEWVKSLPNAKLPDRNDFKSYGDDEAHRQRDWRVALAESARLADEFAALVASGKPFEALPLR
jgi:hypothetical protein